MVNELIRENNRAIQLQMERLFKSGAVDLAVWEDDYKLPKAFMAAACSNMAEQWRPFEKHMQRESRNMLHFI
ncbi:MAG: hypothetical protein WC551_09315 [Patescibacteria group bacterium]